MHFQASKALQTKTYTDLNFSSVFIIYLLVFI